MFYMCIIYVVTNVCLYNVVRNFEPTENALQSPFLNMMISAFFFL